MNHQTISVDKDTFRSPLPPIAAGAFAVAALSGAAALATLFFPASIPAILHDMELGQIYDPTAQRTWLVVYIALTAVNFLAALMLSSGMFQILCGRKSNGADLLYNSAKWALLGLNITGAIILPYFVFRAIRYIFALMQMGIANAMVPLYSMVLSEGLMLAVSCFAFVKLRRFLNCLMDASASIGYTLVSGKLKAPSIPGFAASGFLFLGLIDAVIAMDRFFTFIHRQINYNDYFYFPLSEDPVQIFSGLSFACAALGSILLFFYLRSYKFKSEVLLLKAQD